MVFDKRPSGKDGVADDFSLEFNISAVKIKPMGRSNKKLEDSLAVMLAVKLVTVVNYQLAIPYR